MQFDARAAKLLKPGEHMVIDGCAGLRLVASTEGHSWIYRYKAADGRMKQVKLGRWPAMPIAGAVVVWQAQRQQREAGVDPVAARRAARAAAKGEDQRPVVYTVAHLMQDYISGHLLISRKPAGAKAAQRALLRLLEQAPELAQRPASGVTRADAFNVLDARKATPTSTAKLRSMLGSAWDYALDAGRIPPDVPNWWRQVMAGKLKSKGKLLGGQHVGKTRRTLSPAEVAALLAWLPATHELARDALVMYLSTGARGVEILAMRPEHVARETDGVWWWTVPKALTKNARFDDAVDLRVPLFGRALEVVQRRAATAQPGGWLFAGARAGQHYTQHQLSTYIYDQQPYSRKSKMREGLALAPLPVTGWTSHNLRRTTRTLLAALGCPADVAEAVIGHMPTDIQATYNAHSYDAERKLWLARLSDYLEGLAAVQK